MVLQKLNWLLFVVLAGAFQGASASEEASSSWADQNGERHQGGAQRRVLLKLQGLGGNPDPSSFPLQECQGDCDLDSHCDRGLVCFQKTVPFTAVPGCEGGENDASRTDYCIQDPGGNPLPTHRPTPRPQSTPRPTSKPADSGMIHYLGNDGNPASVFPLPVCGGDCDGDNDCAGDLICYQRDRFSTVPGCSGGEQDSSRTDYCTRPQGGPQPNTPRPTSAPQTDRPTPAPQTAPTRSSHIEYIGNNWNPASAFPLDLCQGDCDSNSDCAENLICFQRGKYQAVPGCLGGERDPSATDYCAPPPVGPQPQPATPRPTPAPQMTSRPTLRPTNRPSQNHQATRMIDYIGNNGSPSSAFPLGLCEGDCDSDSECEGSLVCFQRNSYQGVPGCLGGDRDSSATDYCTLPSGEGPTPMPISRPVTASPISAPQPTLQEVERVGNDGSPSSVFPLGECQGDCDDDDDCDYGLFCYQRSNNDAVPGCAGGSSDRSDTDYCAPLPPDQRPPSGTFRLKLWWQQGYVWQEETKERKWCAMFDYDGYPGSGKCWYGLDTMTCSSQESYIAKCGNENRQRFLFVDLAGGEILIKLGNNDNECWERSSRAVKIRQCDANNPLQRWFSPNGSFNGQRFEISQKGFENQCVSTAHHPKAGEVVEMHSCVALRAPDSETSYWNKY